MKRGRLLAIALLVLLLLVLLSVVAVFSARRDILAGVAQLRAAQSSVSVTSSHGSARAVIDETRHELAAGHTDFAAADWKLRFLRPVLERLWWVPSVGDELADAPQIARLAERTTAGGLALLNGLGPAATVLDGPPTGRVSRLVQALAAQRSTFAGACSDFADAAAARRGVPINTGPHLAQLHTVDQAIPRLRVLCDGLQVAPAMLGYPRPITYLLAYQDPAELRSTGGFIGSYALVGLSDGRSTQQFQNSNFVHENFKVMAPDPVNLYNGERWLFRDSNWSPNFPTSAALERYFFHLDSGRSVDGVINVTPAAAAAALAAIGPFYSPEYHRLVTAANVAALADYYAHWAGVPGPAGVTAELGRKQFIQVVSNHIFAALGRLSIAQLVRLVQSIDGAVATRDILVNVNNPSAQRFIHLAGADGALNGTKSDYLYVVDTNLSYNKINPYVQIRYSYHTTVRSDRWLDSRLSIRFYNSAPAALQQHGLGPGAGSFGGPLEYADFVRIYVPAGAQLVDQNGWLDPWSSGPAYGKTMFCGYIIVPRFEPYVVNLHYVVPPNVFAPTGGSHYRLVVQHQPGSTPDRITVAVTADGRTVRDRIVRPTTDWSTSIPIAHRPFGPIPLPAQPPTIVAPGHWIEPHAYLSGPNQPM